MSDESSLPHEPLSLVETRILGCLIEKEATTPDIYPLTLNSLVNACNQKSNRAPVLDLDDEVVAAAIESLRHKHLVLLVTQTVARVAKYKHNLDTVYPIPKPQIAILAELLLRGPQTAGELRTRCERMCPIGGLDSMREELDQLSSRATPLILELPRQLGKKDSRFTHLLSGPPDLEALTSAAPASAPVKVDVALTLPAEAETRIATLESTVSTLETKVSALESTLAQQSITIATLQNDLATFRAQFE
ncbi:conserved hypothetical protein [Verrucomicrobiia bacterium DG1235]|nr:conserved hypothetical protein [Verrucomicrobiae bacterium DG1235]